jgi:hypothetical protein
VVGVGNRIETAILKAGHSKSESRQGRSLKVYIGLCEQRPKYWCFYYGLPFRANPAAAAAQQSLLMLRKELSSSC